ncbi:YraN family protein [Stappia stellulata]|uniref:YraN family protein n=1 Tax=Stappia stellulata TaxID=71235 RepID=UPI00068789FF|nr:YraN family protein [Stappia stellulata]
MPPLPPRPAPSRKRRSAYRLGLRAETLAVVALRLRGWRILARRYKAGSGEIDIIARKGDTIAFVEVKARATRDAALAAITAQGQRRIAAAARVWQARREDADAAVLRFDAVLVVPGRWPIHVADAFTAPQR